MVFKPETVTEANVSEPGFTPMVLLSEKSINAAPQGSPYEAVVDPRTMLGQEAFAAPSAKEDGPAKAMMLNNREGPSDDQSPRNLDEAGTTRSFAPIYDSSSVVGNGLFDRDRDSPRILNDLRAAQISDAICNCNPEVLTFLAQTLPHDVDSLKQIADALNGQLGGTAFVEIDQGGKAVLTVSDGCVPLTRIVLDPNDCSASATRFSGHKHVPIKAVDLETAMQDVRRRFEPAGPGISETCANI
jgi:hypothetical protein